MVVYYTVGQEIGILNVEKAAPTVDSFGAGYRWRSADDFLGTPNFSDLDEPSGDLLVDQHSKP